MLLVTSVGLQQLTTSPVFALDPATITIDGLHYTDATAVRAAMGFSDGERPNLFRLSSSELQRALRELPAVQQAKVHIILPDELQVSIEERSPILAWQQGDDRLLVDVGGTAFASASADDALPTIADRRTVEQPLAVGATMPALDLEVARLLGAVGPGEVGSAARSLTLSVDDVDGWVLEAAGAWRAVFGHYTVTLRPPASIHEQVACLRGLLASREADVAAVTLALSPDGCGTFRERTERTPSGGREPGGSPTERP